MSVTNHNALWGDASEFGRFMKIETTDYAVNYNSRYGDDSDGYQDTSEFILLQEDGTAALDDKGNQQTLDEQSGTGIVTRVYGDVYYYNSGNEYTWGGNGTTYNFGNGWEENHIGVSDPCVPPDEVFNFPETDSSNWNTSKTWGQEYSYNKGVEYSWQEGYADSTDTLKNNHFCSYSIGLNYEESYTVAPSGKTVASAKSGFTSSYDDWSGSSLGLSAATLAVSKSYGDGYEYTCGKGYSIQEGDTEEHVYGKSTSQVHGDSNENVHGNSTSDVTGDSDETVHGNSTSHVYGNSTETIHGDSLELFAGGKAEFFTGGINSMSIAAVNEMSLTGKIELTIGGVMSVMMGAVMEITLGLKMEVQAGGKIEVGDLVDVKAKASAKIDACLAEIKSTATAIKTAALQLFA